MSLRLSLRLKLISCLLVPVLLVVALWNLHQRRLDFALFVAAPNSQPKRIIELVGQGANVNTRQRNGNTPLHNAALASGDNSETIKQLILSGANVNAANDEGDSPLQYAIMVENESSVRVLVQAGADVNAKSKRFGTPLHQAMVALHQECRVSPTTCSISSLNEIVSILRKKMFTPDLQQMARLPIPEPSSLHRGQMESPCPTFGVAELGIALTGSIYY